MSIYIRFAMLERRERKPDSRPLRSIVCGSIRSPTLKGLSAALGIAPGRSVVTSPSQS